MRLVSAADMQNDPTRKEVQETGCLFYIVSLLVVVAGVIWLEPIIQGWFPSYEGDIFAILLTCGLLGVIPVETYLRNERGRRHWLEYEYPRMTKRAEAGNPQDQYNLGWSIFLGGSEKQCVPVSFWMLKSAEQGYLNAQTFLASHYKFGREGNADLEKAFFWFRKAADQGDCHAQLELGNCYADGLGVPIDIVEAVSWYRKAAEHPGEAQNWGDGLYSETEWTDDHYAVEARRKLGAIYHSGLGVIKDEIEAYAYFSLAGTSSDTDRKTIADIEGKMTPAQIRDGKRRLSQMRKKLKADREALEQG